MPAGGDAAKHGETPRQLAAPPEATGTLPASARYGGGPSTHTLTIGTRQLVSIARAAAYCGVITRTIYNRIADCRLRAYRAGPKLLGIDRADLERLAALSRPPAMASERRSDAVQRDWTFALRSISLKQQWGLPVSRLDRLSSVGRGRPAVRLGVGGTRCSAVGMNGRGAVRSFGGRVAGRAIRVPEPMARPAVRDPVAADWDAAGAVTALYAAHYRSLVHLAVLLVRDVGTAEEVVQESFIAMHSRWRLLRDSEKGLSYLRRSVVNGSRSVLRHRLVVDRNAPESLPDMPSAEEGAVELLERSAMVAALRRLPPRQREVLVLRYYGDLSETQIAQAMGISPGAVKSHAARAISSLRSLLENQK